MGGVAPRLGAFRFETEPWSSEQRVAARRPLGSPGPTKDALLWCSGSSQAEGNAQFPNWEPPGGRG